MIIWNEHHQLEARARLCELCAMLIRQGRENEYYSSSKVLKDVLFDPWSASSAGLFYGVVKAAGFDAEKELQCILEMVF